MDDKRIAEWAQRLYDQGRDPFSKQSPIQLIESAARTLLSEAIAEYKEDAERLNWFDAHKFTAYRSYGVNHTTLVNEEREPRRGIVKRNIRECIDATRASEMHGPLSARKSESEHG